LKDLLPVDQALTTILSAFQPATEELVPLKDAYYRVLSRNINATTDLPPFTNSSMDGFAVISQDTSSASYENPVSLTIDYDIPAGSNPEKSILPGHAARIMTGAPVPQGADAVVQVESTDSSRHDSSIKFPFNLKVFSPIKSGENIRLKGMDTHKGDPVLKSSSRLRPQEISALASFGFHQVPVHRTPRLAILSTGDELVPPEQPLLPGKIHESNSYSLEGLSKSMGCEVINLGIVGDDKNEIKRKLDLCCDLNIDLIMTSAGVSVGAFDFMKDVIRTNGKIDFWRVNMRPGKPIAFGSYRGIPLIGLAGNPVSAFVGFLVFIRPVVLKISGIKDLLPEVIPMTIDSPVESDGRQSYLRATSVFKDGKWIAHPASHQGSGNVLSLVNANTLLIIRPGVKSLPINSTVDAWLLD
jgi:molybdopterin molybdotransferase